MRHEAWEEYLQNVPSEGADCKQNKINGVGCGDERTLTQTKPLEFDYEASL